MMQYMLNMPYPPSVNTYWRHPTKGPLAGRHLISEKGRAYREAVRAMFGGRKPIAGRLVVSIIMYPPDRRKRDVDNILKATLDGLTYAGVWGDDGQVDKLVIERSDVRPGGGLYVTVAVIPEIPKLLG